MGPGQGKEQSVLSLSMSKSILKSTHAAFICDTTVKLIHIWLHTHAAFKDAMWSSRLRPCPCRTTETCAAHQVQTAYGSQSMRGQGTLVTMTMAVVVMMRTLVTMMMMTRMTMMTMTMMTMTMIDDSCLFAHSGRSQNRGRWFNLPSPPPSHLHP